MRQARVWIIRLLTAIFTVAARGQNTHSANISLTHDPVGDGYLGASNSPSGNSNISLVGGSPGYLNSIFGTFRVSQVVSDTTAGGVTVTPSR